MGGVDAQLMGAAGVRGEADSRVGGPPFDHLPVGDAWLAVDRIEDLQGAVVHINAEGEFDVARVRFDDSLYQCDVALVHPALFELQGQMAVRLGGESEYHQSRGLHIQAMGGQRPTGGGEEFADPGDDTIVHVGIPAWHGQKIGHFVDDDEAVLVMQNGEWPVTLIGGAELHDGETCAASIPRSRNPRMG